MTLSRGENFHTNADPARQRYNPAMIEVGGETEQGTVSSLILTTSFWMIWAKYEGEYFVQADSEGDGETTVSRSEVPNTSIVQDAIIATYNGMGTITLGDGAELRNYGGMSAVRLSGGRADHGRRRAIWIQPKTNVRKVRPAALAPLVRSAPGRHLDHERRHDRRR